VNDVVSRGFEVKFRKPNRSIDCHGIASPHTPTGGPRCNKPSLSRPDNNNNNSLNTTMERSRRVVVVHAVRTFRCRGYYTRSDRRADGRPFHRCFPHLLSSGRWPPPSPGRPPVGTEKRNRWSPYSPDDTSPSRISALRICTKRRNDMKTDRNTEEPNLSVWESVARASKASAEHSSGRQRVRRYAGLPAAVGRPSISKNVVSSRPLRNDEITRDARRVCNVCRLPSRTFGFPPNPKDCAARCALGFA